MTDFYEASSIPTQGASLKSQVVRTEFAAIATAMALLAPYTGAGSEIIRVNAGGTAYESITAATLFTSPVLTTPQINDTSADHQYIFGVSELVADRTVTLPLLTGDDEFVFKDHTQTLTNKTLTAPAVTGMTGGAATGFTVGTLTFADGSITDSSGAINFGNENLVTTGTLGAGATTVTTLTASTSLALASGATVTAILDEDAMGSDSPTALATQQSIKAFVAASAGNETLAQTLVLGNTSGATDLVIDSGQAITANTINETTGAAGVTIDSVLLKDNTVLAGTLLIGAGSITDSSGAIDFGNENLVTTGTLGAGATTVTTLTATDDVTLTKAGANQLNVSDTLNGITTQIINTSSAGWIGTTTNQPFRLFSNNLSAVIIDTSQNATFAGDVALSSGSVPVVISSSGTNFDYTATHNGSSLTMRLINSGSQGFNLDVVEGDVTLSSGALSVTTAASTHNYLDLDCTTTGFTTGVRFQNAGANTFLTYRNDPGNYAVYNYGTSVTSFQINASTDAATFAGNVIIGTAGKGIDFSATSDGTGTMTSELLDDYEEGSWTPVLATPTGSCTMGYQQGNYTKVGNRVTFQTFFSTSSLNGATGGLRIEGLPYTSGTEYCAVNCGYGSDLATVTGQALAGYMTNANTKFNLAVWDYAGGISILDAAEWSANGSAMYSGSYAV